MSDENPVLQPPGGGHYRRVNSMPEDERDLLKAMVYEQRETNRRLEKIEKELLGEEGDRQTGVVFRLSAVEQKVALAQWIVGAIGIVVIGLVVTKWWSVMDSHKERAPIVSTP